MPTYVTNRMILREYPGDDFVGEFAASKGWSETTEQPEPLKKPGENETAWDAGGEAVLRYREDSVSPNCWITVESDTPELVSVVAQEVHDALSPWSLQDLATQVDHASDPIQLAQAIIRLGIAAPRRYDQRIFDRIAAALTHQATEVRDVAIWSTTYSPWSEYRPMLSNIAEHDPVEKLRERAQATLEAFDATGVE